MQTKNLNSYSIIHRNGNTELINAESAAQAIANMTVPETESPVIRVLMTAMDVKTVCEDVVPPEQSEDSSADKDGQ